MFGSFASLDELWQGTLEYVLKFGKEHVGREGKKTKELLGPVLRLVNTNANLLTHVGRFASPIYAAGEFMWYMSGSADGQQIMWYAPSYHRFIEVDGKAHGGYGERLSEGSQIARVLKLLAEKPETRQAILSIWRPSDLYHSLLGDKRDIPCTISLQFLVRDGCLNCIATMRSNDLWLGVPYDIFCFSTLQNFMADQLGLIRGFYQHQPGSLHLYERNFDDALFAESVGASPVNFHFEGDEFFWEALPEAIRLEREFRILDDINLGHFGLLRSKFGCGSRWGFILGLCLLNSSSELSKECLEAANEFIPEIPLTMAMHIRKKRDEKRAKNIRKE